MITGKLTSYPLALGGYSLARKCVGGAGGKLHGVPAGIRRQPREREEQQRGEGRGGEVVHSGASLCKFVSCEFACM